VPGTCRCRATSVDEHCEHASEEDRWNCLQFGRAADYVEARGSGRLISTEEALELCDEIEDDGLLHMWANNGAMEGVATMEVIDMENIENWCADEGSEVIEKTFGSHL
jgi:hypothetical protein